MPDVVAPGLAVLFCGINPSTRSGQLGLHFARPGNRFWRVVHAAGWTDRVLLPAEAEQLLAHGVGITNLVGRPSLAASDLRPDELRAGAIDLAAKVSGWRPRWVAFLGIQAYRTAFGRPGATVGPQDERLDWPGAGSGLWVLPNPSGLQAHYQVPAMVALHRELRFAALGGDLVPGWRPT